MLMGRLDEDLRASLLRRARAAIARAIGADHDRVMPVAGPIPRPESPIPRDFRAGAFVTLRVRGRLRGCIGYADAERPLIDVVEHCAVSATSDPRFPPVTIVEWNELALEISVLGPIEPVGHISEVIVGRHGLIVEFGRRRGLLLPQVAVEWKFDAVEFAAETCVKAGLPRNAWEKGARLFKFEAEVFGEERE
jgi:AmmeMemoRadiSam system protein A